MASSDEDSEKFCGILRKTLNGMEGHMKKRIIIMGDFSSQIGQVREEEKSVIREIGQMRL